MADDTRQTELPPAQNGTEPEFRRPRRPKPKHDFPKTQAGKLWDAFGNPEEPVNTMPGGMVNSAGGRPPEVTWRDAFKNPFINKDGRRFYQIPCAKDSLMVGISAGGAVGGVRFILKGWLDEKIRSHMDDALTTAGLTAILTTTNWAVGGFAVATMGMYTWCESRRKEEEKGMAAAVIGMKMLNDKKARERAIEEAAQKAAEEAREKSKPWYKVW